MDVVVRSHNIELTSGLRALAQRKLGRIERIAPDASRAEIDFSDQRNPRVVDHTRCAVTVHLRRGSVTARAQARAPEVALDLVVEKLRHQVERRKVRRVTHGHGAQRARQRGPARS